MVVHAYNSNPCEAEAGESLSDSRWGPAYTHNETLPQKNKQKKKKRILGLSSDQNEVTVKSLGLAEPGNFSCHYTNLFRNLS